MWGLWSDRVFAVAEKEGDLSEGWRRPRRRWWFWKKPSRGDDCCGESAQRRGPGVAVSPSPTQAPDSLHEAGIVQDFSGGESSWQRAVLKRATEYLDGESTCREGVTVLKAEVEGTEIVFHFVRSWQGAPEGTVGLRVSPDSVLPSAGFTSTDEDGPRPLRDCEVDAVAFDIAVLLMCAPFRAEDVGPPDSAGVRWRRLT